MKTFIISIFCLAQLLANKDVMMFGSLKSFETKSSNLELTRGASSISVFTTSESFVTCQFVDVNGALTSEQKKVKLCSHKTEVDSSTKLTLRITNEEDRLVDYRIHLVTQ